jgi:preprotein translocase subunit SecB
VNVKSQEPSSEQVNKKVIPENLIECLNIGLKECSLVPLPSERKEEPRIQFAITPIVFGNDRLISELRICLINIVSEEPFAGQELTFAMAGVFKGSEETTKEQMGEFGQLYTLSILWPYAREFAQDILHRTGRRYSPLPVINPTGTTLDLLEQGQITVIFKEKSDQKSKAENVEKESKLIH